MHSNMWLKSIYDVEGLRINQKDGENLNLEYSMNWQQDFDADILQLLIDTSC